MIKKILLFPLWLIRRFLTGVRNIFRPVIKYFSEDLNEDSTVAEALDKAVTEPVGLLPHLHALRGHVLRVLVALIGATVLVIAYSHEVIVILQHPIQHLPQADLRISGPGEVLDLIPRISLSVALLLILPYILMEAYWFVAPGLNGAERLWSLFLGAGFITLMTTGLAFFYFVVIPEFMTYLYYATINYGTYDWELVRYLSFMTKLLFITELAFMMPLITLIISVYSKRKPQLNLKLVIFLMFLFAAFLTPGSMVVLDMGLAALLTIFYLFYYLLFRLTFRPRYTP